MSRGVAGEEHDRSGEFATLVDGIDFGEKPLREAAGRAADTRVTARAWIMDILLPSGQARKPPCRVKLMNSAVGRRCLEASWQTIFLMALSTKQVTTFKQQFDRIPKSIRCGKA